MAFTMLRSQSAFTDREKENIEGATTEDVNMISSQLQLKSQSMDKHAVLRRIRQRRFNNRAKSALEVLIGIGTSEANNTVTGLEKWLQLGDTFSSP